MSHKSNIVMLALLMVPFTSAYDHYFLAFLLEKGMDTTSCLIIMGYKDLRTRGVMLFEDIMKEIRLNYL